MIGSALEAHRVVEKLAFLEESLELDGGALGAIRCVGDVFHHGRSKVPTERAFCGLGGIRRPEKLTHPVYGIISSQGHRDERRGAHESFDFGEEWLRGDVSIMLAQEARIGTEHFAPTDLESGIFKALQDFSSLVPGDAVGLQKNQRCLHKRGNLTCDPQTKSRFSLDAAQLS